MNTRYVFSLLLMLVLLVSLGGSAQAQDPLPASSADPQSIDSVSLPYYGALNSANSAFGVTNTGAGAGLAGQSDNGVAGIVGYSANKFGVYGISPNNTGVRGVSTAGFGMYGASVAGVGVYGEHPGSNFNHGVIGATNNGYGVLGVSYGGGGSSTGVRGQSTASDGNGVWGVANNGSDAWGVYGESTLGYAGFFSGDVEIEGELFNSAASLKIDHPLDPATKTLAHSVVASPDRLNVYNGNVTTDKNGEATVSLPAYFEALNRDYRYQLTVIGQFAQAIVASKVKDNRFTIKTDKPNVEVSWQVTGIRQDAYAKANPIVVEEDKPEAERGFYFHPDLFGQPETKGITWARKPELMQQMQAERDGAPAKSEAQP